MFLQMLVSQPVMDLKTACPIACKTCGGPYPIVSNLRNCHVDCPCRYLLLLSYFKFKNVHLACHYYVLGPLMSCHDMFLCQF